ncbi:MAG: hypothetical protein LPK14_01505, partial [Hymenobacteraceae bacterium]|nr:hypothetical protein [Hymenobacteraceae bacterium]
MRNLNLKKSAFALLVSAGLLSFSGCTSTDKLNASAPATTTAATPVYQPKLSSISVPVSVSIAAIEQKLNQEVNGVLYKDDK